MKKDGKVGGWNGLENLKRLTEIRGNSIVN